MTYPRTDSRFLTDDMEAMLPALVEKVREEVDMKIEHTMVRCKQVLNNKKVSDHHAIIPTKSVEHSQIEALPSGEKAVYQLISTRLLCAVDVPYRYEETTCLL